MFLLAVAIGANVTIFSIAYAILHHGSAYRNANSLAAVKSITQVNGNLWPVKAAEYLDWKTAIQAIEELALYRGGESFQFTGDGDPERLLGATVTASLFPLLGRSVKIGRVFQAQEEQPGLSRVVVLSHALWARRFGASPDVIGQKVHFNGSPYEVIGVMPAEFCFPDVGTELWTPLVIPPKEIQERFLHRYQALVRIRSGVSREQAQAEMDRYAAAMTRLYPLYNKDMGLRLFDWDHDVFGQTKAAVRILAGAVAAVLLIACANLACLFLARLNARRNEMNIRRAIGASQWALVRLMLIECLALSIAGGAAGLLVASWTTRLVAGSLPPGSSVSLSLPSILFTLLLCVVTTVAFGLLPAILHSGESRPQRDRSGRAWMRGLLAFEVAAAVFLLAGAGLLLRSLQEVLEVNPGFRPERVQTLRLALPKSKYQRPAQISQFADQVLAEAQSLPSVERVAIVDRLAMDGTTLSGPLAVKDRPVEAQITSQVDHRAVSPAFFQVMGIPLIRGRQFDRTDAAESRAVVVIDETIARRYFAGEDPIGKVVRPGSPAMNLPWSEVIGIVGTVRNEGLDRESLGTVYAPFAQRPNDRFAIVAHAPPSMLRQAVRAVDPQQSVFLERPMRAIVDATLSSRRFGVNLLFAFAVIALVMAAAGLFSVTQYGVAQRTREISLRMALGAQPGQLLALVLRENAITVIIGEIAGIACAILFHEVIDRFLFGVKAADLNTLGVVSGAIFLTALLASILPAWRATKLHPAQVLRS